jgi:hypothetical protein
MVVLMVVPSQSSELSDVDFMSITVVLVFYPAVLYCPSLLLIVKVFKLSYENQCIMKKESQSTWDIDLYWLRYVVPYI